MARYYVYAGQPRPADNGNGKGGPSLLVLALLVISLALYTQRDDATGSARRSVQAVQPTSTVETVWGPDTWQSPQVVEQAYIAWRPEAEEYVAWRPQVASGAVSQPVPGVFSETPHQAKEIHLERRPDNIELLYPDSLFAEWTCGTTGGRPNVSVEDRGAMCVPKEVMTAAAWIEYNGGMPAEYFLINSEIENNLRWAENCSPAGGGSTYCGGLQMSDSHYSAHACWPGGNKYNVLDAMCSMSNWATRYKVSPYLDKNTFSSRFTGRAGTWAWNVHTWHSQIVWEGARALRTIRAKIWSELAQGAIQPAQASTSVGGGNWRRPVEGSWISQRFGYTDFVKRYCSYGRDANGQCKPHTGVDLVTKTGVPIYSSWSGGGKVIFAGWYDGYGNMVKVNHGNGYQTLYGHMSKILVKQGQEVNGQTPLGLVGSTGKSDGPHVHWEVYKDGQLVDPLSLTGD